MSDTLDLSIIDAGKTSAVAVARSGRDLVVEEIPFGADLVALLAFRDRLDKGLRALAPRPTSQEVAAFGESLFAFCIRDRLRRLYDRLPAQVRIHVLTSQSALQALPWEYLQEPGQVPGPRPDRNVVRVVPTLGTEPPAPRAKGEPIRVLFVWAEPMDQGPIGWEVVEARLRRIFSEQAPERVEITVVEAATAPALAKAITSSDFDVFHFCGHGEVDAAGNGRLLLRSTATKNTSKPMDAAQLAGLLRGRDVRLAVLGACDTSAGDFGKEFGVIATTLVSAGLPAVVAHQLPIPEATVAVFVGAVYEELLDSGDIDRAVGEGRVMLKNAFLDSEDGIVWGVPTLHRHFAASRLFA